MSDTIDLIRGCIARGEVRVSRHGGAELRADGIGLEDVLTGVTTAVPIEDYQEAFKGPSVLALHRLRDGRPAHVVWGLAKGTESPAVLVTAYRPDPTRWSAGFLVRRTP